jgi:hypothetical protein
VAVADPNAGLVYKSKYHDIKRVQNDQKSGFPETS